ncbi:class I SAM-dependent methyltransferase [Flavobacterium silvaticum]|nr:class I SAM-dependent methyltransferase [Flavobacterium silvaticum]
METLLHTEVQDWLKKNADADVRLLALKKNPFPEIPYPDLMNQILAREKCRHKLPLWFGTDGILYPEKISIEQSSSQATAEFKASLVSGDSLFDATGGFGVDDHYFAQKMKTVVHCEMNQALSETVSHNANILGDGNLEPICADSSEFLTSSDRTFDWIYVDPSRRNDKKGKVFLLADCLPNVPESLDLYFEKAPNILVKVSPMLDISQGISELPNVSAIYVVALENEVKEVLFVLDRNFNAKPQWFTINLESSQSELFPWSDFDQSAPIGSISNYLYEPDAAIRKAGVFDEVGVKFGLRKLHRNTHLYTSDELVKCFPGRSFLVNQQITYTKSEMKPALYGQKANVAVRNFPETVEQIRNKWKISDGGDRYCFFVTDSTNDKIVLFCSKIS